MNPICTNSLQMSGEADQ